MYILSQKLKKSLAFRQYILFFSFIYLTSVLILLYRIPSENFNNESIYKDGTIISNQKQQRISRKIPLYTINVSNNTIVGSLRISSSKRENNKFEISGYLYFTYNNSNISNMKYMLVSGESCYNWNAIVQDISSKIYFKSLGQQSSQGTKILRRIRETSFNLSNKIESASHFVIAQNSGHKSRQLACTPLNSALKTNTF